MGAVTFGTAGTLLTLDGCRNSNETSVPEHKDYTDKELESLSSSLLSGMTLEQKAAQVLTVTPEALAGVDRALYAGERTDEAIAACPVGGLFYSGLNMAGEDQIKSMVNNARVLSSNAGAHITAILTVSEEGGTIESPIANAAEIESIPTKDAADIGAEGDASKAAEAAIIIADYLKQLGFNTNFAPNANVATNADSPLGARIFSTDTDVVTDMVAAEVESYINVGMPCVPKHFPGVGDSAEHYVTGVPETDMTYEQIAELALPPFQAAIREGCPCIAVSALKTPAVTGDDTPAAASSYWVKDVLRGKLGFEGVIFGARMDGQGIQTWKGMAEAGLAMLNAGCDMLLLPETPADMQQAIIDAVGNGGLSQDDLDAAVKRILKFKLNWNILEE